ncbi:hypothetical protein [Paenibacillus sp. 1P03SA]
MEEKLEQIIVLLNRIEEKIERIENKTQILYQQTVDFIKDFDTSKMQ